MLRNLLLAVGVTLALGLLFYISQAAGIVGTCLAIAWFFPLQLRPQPLRVRVIRREDAYQYLRRNRLN
ncbi:MAG TPA: hypothetical protein V6C81_21420 [Planktothrix sp.]|jgi:hypothetical protein